MTFITDKMADAGIIAYIGLGTNLGDRELNLRTALKELGTLPTIELCRMSSLYETAPVGLTEQPDFLNQVVSVRTTLSPRQLLNALLHIENKMGRTRTIRWGPRVIDLDLLVYGNAQVEMPGLTVPHPRLRERAFVLTPLAEIAPALILPGGEETIESLSGKLGKIGNIRRVEIV